MSATEKTIYRLVLHPKDANYVPESNHMVQDILHEMGFVGAPHRSSTAIIETENLPSAFLVGDQFLQLLTFMGCSPNINLAPQHQGDQDFCHVVLSTVSSSPQFRSHERDVFARCPACTRRDANWLTSIEHWQENVSQHDYTCPHCEEKMSLYDLRWRHAAGFGRFFIDVFSIFPQEGIPTDNLLFSLEKACGQSWNYFFTNR